MQAGFGVRLAVDYGAASTAAVLVWPDGRWLRLTFDGVSVLPSAVFVEAADRFVVGRAALQRGSEDPGGLIECPLRAGTGSVAAGGVEVAVQDAVAATLRRVGEEAARVAGGPVADVRLVVPAGWGPKRRTWMRQAAYRAGLGQPTLVDAPVAAADQLLAQGLQLPVGAFVLMCDAGAGFEVSVLRRGPSGFEALSTLADSDAGGNRIDHSLAQGMAAVEVTAGAAAPADVDEHLLSVHARVAKESLVQVPAVMVPMPPPRPALVVTSAMLAEAARPVVQRAAQLCVDAVAAAELTAEQLAGVYCIGGGANLAALPQAISERLGRVPTVVSEPDAVAVFGATQSGAGVVPQAREVAPSPVLVPPLRRVAAMAVPGAASLLLVAHFLYTADYGGSATRTYRPYGGYVIANWGELAMACLMVMVGSLAIGSVLGALTSGLQGPAGDAQLASPASQAGTGILAAAALGVAVAGMYGVLSLAYLNIPASSPLRWALLPVVPTAVIAVAVALLAARWRRLPVQGWDGFLAFPMSSVLTASAGMLLVQQAMKTPSVGLLGRFGGLLIGVGVATALVSPWILRLIVAVPVGVTMAAIVSWRATGILAAIYAIAVTLWWGKRLWALLRSPTTEPVHPAAMASPVGAWPGG